MFYGTQPITFQNARRLRKNMTPTEKILWSYLGKKQLNGMRFRKQHPIGDYIADFYCHELKLIIEVDGPIHNQKLEYDRTRTEEMAKVGLQVIRFTNDEIIADIGSVIEKIKCARN
jgi:very-short-patch-repair endonuclease